MTRTNLLLLTAAAVAVLSPALEAQGPVRVRTAGFY